jgi:hypothetical protein
VIRLPHLLRRGAAAVLLVLVVLPWYPLVARRGAGPPVEQTLRLGQLYYANLRVSVALTVLAVLLLGRPLRGGVAVRLWRPFERVMLAPTPAQLGVVLGAAATSMALWVSAGPLDRRPALLDGVAQLLQARYLADGRLAGPLLDAPEFWQFQFMVLGERGWVSQYPPGFTVLLGFADPLGAAWIVGPLLLGIAIGLTTLVAHRLFAGDPLVARLGALLATLSPMLAFHAGAYMSHVLALALAVLAVFAALESDEGSWRWALLCGAALGALFATRPYTALVMGSVAAACVGLWTEDIRASAPPAPVPGTRGRFRVTAACARWTAVVALGAAPFLAGVLWYNGRYFGSPFQFGYEAAEGPGHRLGFHVDPWGNPYGPLEATAYTSADLQALGVELLQSPIPVVLIVGLYLLFARRLSPGVRIAAFWAALPVAAHALYWHHDLFMGPRMLYEALPAWCLLLAAAVVGAVRAVPVEGRPVLRVATIRRSGLAGTFALAVLIGAVYAGPRKLASYGAEGARSGMTLARPATSGPSLVFVHGSWEDRIAARLAGAGMRVDSIRAALASNSTCALERYLEGGGPDWSAGVAGLSFDRAAGRTLRELRMRSGSVIRASADEVLHPLCERQAQSDFAAGVVGLPPLLWQGDLPGLPPSGPMFVRDLGPERNRELIARFPERQPNVLLLRNGGLELVGYDEGMAALWSASAAGAAPP